MTLDLESMTDAERADLEARLAYLRVSKKSAPQYSRAETALWDTLSEMFKHRSPIDRFVRGMDGTKGFGVQRFLACAQLVDDLITRSCALGTRKPTRDGLRRVVLDSLHRWLKSRNIPASPTSLLTAIDKLEHAVEQDYPGYIEAGILSFVLDPLPTKE